MHLADKTAANSYGVGLHAKGHESIAGIQRLRAVVALGDGQQHLADPRPCAGMACTSNCPSPARR